MKLQLIPCRILLQKSNHRARGLFRHRLVLLCDRVEMKRVSTAHVMNLNLSRMRRRAKDQVFTLLL